MRRYGFLAAALLAVNLPVAAQAANPFGPVGYFNAMIFGNAEAVAGDTEGRLAVGGNLTASSYSVGFHSAPDATKNSLVVGGSLNAIGMWQVFNGNTRYGSLVATPSTVAPYTIQQQNNVVDFAGAYTALKGTSNFLSTLPANGAGLYQWTTYTLTGTDPNFNVFTVNPADWAAASNRIINAPTGSTVVVNVAGASGSLANGMQLQGVSRNYVMFNYYQATTLNFSNIAVLGSLLAPDAYLTLTGGNVDGISVLAKSKQQNGGEYHNYPFLGSTPVPEPTTMLALGSGLMTLFLRRKK